MNEALAAVLFFIGLVAVLIGTFLIHPGLCLVTLGAILMYVADHI